MSRRSYLLASLFAFALVLLPFLFWYDTWFGRRLNDAKVDEYLSDAAKPRRAQHALVQIGERLGRGDRSVVKWYPKIIELSRASSAELRQTAAWIMGQDPTHEPFRAALANLRDDHAVLVRRNAALSLAAFRDASARPELRAMLRPFQINAPAGGVVRYRLENGEYVNAGTLVARIDSHEVRAAVPGEMRARLRSDGSRVSEGEPLAEIAPDEKHAWEALRALYLVGAPEDLEEIRRYARGVPGMQPRIREQAALTEREIEQRAR